MYPNITLQIKNHKPLIVFKPNESESKVITEKIEDIADIMINLAKKLDLENEIASQINDREIIIENLLQLARESDETKVSAYTDLDATSTEFELKKAVDSFFKNAENEKEDFDAIVEASVQVKKELQRNQNSDIFAAGLDAIYNILIAKTLIAAEQLGIGTIKLDDEHENIRLYEKMVQELSKIGISLNED